MGGASSQLGKDIFALIDADKSGALDAQECKNLYMNISSYPALRGVLGENYDIMKCSDENKDGKVSVEELQKFFAANKLTEKNLQTIKSVILDINKENALYNNINATMAALDADKSGDLDADEVLMLMNMLSSSSDTSGLKNFSEEIKSYLGKVDVSKDGKIQKSEFVGWYRASKLTKEQQEALTKACVDFAPSIAKYCSEVRKARAEATKEIKQEVKQTEAKAVCGGVSKARATGGEEQKILDSVKAECEKLHKKTFSTWKALSVKTQVVAGINYTFEVDVGDNAVFIVKVYRKLDQTCQVTQCTAKA